MGSNLESVNFASFVKITRNDPDAGFVLNTLNKNTLKVVPFGASRSAAGLAIDGFACRLRLETRFDLQDRAKELLLWPKIRQER